MNKKIASALVAPLLMFSVASFAQAPVTTESIVGAWEMTLQSPMGELKSRLDFSDEDGSLSGTIQDQFAGTRDLAVLSEVAGLVSFQVELVGIDGPVTMSYEGFLDGDTLAGTMTASWEDPVAVDEFGMPLLEEPDPTSVEAPVVDDPNMEPLPSWGSEFTAVRIYLEEPEQPDDPQ